MKGAHSNILLMGMRSFRKKGSRLVQRRAPSSSATSRPAGSASHCTAKRQRCGKPTCSAGRKLSLHTEDELF